MENIAAFDLSSGEPVWTQPNHEYSWVSERPAYLEKNLVYRAAMAGAWHRRTEADSVFGSLSTDGRMVVAVHDPDQSRFEFPLTGAPQRPGPQNGAVSGVRWNRLCGYEILSKELRWQIGGPPTGPADVLGGMSFLGAPLFVDDLLFGIGRKDDELRLLAIDRDTGHLRWSMTLGVLPPHLADAAARRRIATPVSLVDGLLLCPTASGALVAVDPVTRSIAWVFRHSMIQHDLPVRPVNGTSQPGTPDVWWSEWRDVGCVATSMTARGADTSTPLVLLTSPDSDELHAVNRRDGNAPVERITWQRVASGGRVCGHCHCDRTDGDSCT